MIYFDESMQGVILADEYVLLREVDEDEDITFKASFVVITGIKCEGKVVALFDLIVLGDIECDNLEVKGRLICIGNCRVSDSLVVQNEIWANDITSTSIYCHDRLFAQGIDSSFIKTDGDIIIGKTLAIENKAETIQKVLCGETAYGAGKIIASTIITAEELDLDDGEEAIEHPFVYKPQSGTSKINKDLQRYVQNNDYKGYINVLKSVEGRNNLDLCSRSLKVFSTLNEYYPQRMSEFADVSILLWLIEMINSGYYSVWPQLNVWYKAIIERFNNLINGQGIPGTILNESNTLNEGYIVSHKKFGYGLVTSIVNEETSCFAKIKFEEFGEKTFQLPESLKLFTLISESEDKLSIDNVRDYLKCSIENYNEWLAAITTLNCHRDFFSNELFNIINDLLLAQIGLKTKYIRDRLKEKGWETYE